MDREKLKHYKRRLQELKASLEGEIEQSSSDSAPVQLDGSMGRVSRGDAIQAQQMALEVKRRREIRLLRIQSALSRIEQETYGLCLRCEEPIDEGRLESIPDVVLCVPCASSGSR